MPAVCAAAPLTRTCAAKICCAEVPGPPTGLLVESIGLLLIRVSFRFPRVPHHGVPCESRVLASSGAIESTPCPASSLLDSASGGSRILRFVAEWDVEPSFSSGLALGSPGRGERYVSVDPSAPFEPMSVAIPGQPGMRVFVRVRAETSAGPGPSCETLGEPASGICSSVRPRLVWEW
jgi:hypothetical protein